MPVKRILVVDDSATDRQFLLESLTRLGYQVLLAQSGEEAIAKTRSERDRKSTRLNSSHQ